VLHHYSISSVPHRPSTLWTALCVVDVSVLPHYHSVRDDFATCTLVTGYARLLKLSSVKCRPPVTLNAISVVCPGRYPQISNGQKSDPASPKAGTLKEQSRTKTAL